MADKKGSGMNRFMWFTIVAMLVTALQSPNSSNTRHDVGGTNTVENSNTMSATRNLCSTNTSSTPSTSGGQPEGSGGSPPFHGSTPRNVLGPDVANPMDSVTASIADLTLRTVVVPVMMANSPGENRSSQTQGDDKGSLQSEGERRGEDVVALAWNEILNDEMFSPDPPVESMNSAINSPSSVISDDSGFERGHPSRPTSSNSGSMEVPSEEQESWINTFLEDMIDSHPTMGHEPSSPDLLNSDAITELLLNGLDVLEDVLAGDIPETDTLDHLLLSSEQDDDSLPSLMPSISSGTSASLGQPMLDQNRMDPQVAIGISHTEGEGYPSEENQMAYYHEGYSSTSNSDGYINSNGHGTGMNEGRPTWEQMGPPSHSESREINVKREEEVATTGDQPSQAVPVSGRLSSTSEDWRSNSPETMSRVVPSEAVISGDSGNQEDTNTNDLSSGYGAASGSVHTSSEIASSYEYYGNHSYALCPEDSPADLSLSTDSPYSREQMAREEAEEEAQFSRDERRARSLRIPIHIGDIINLPIDEFNERLSKYELTDTQLSLIRDIRRRGKNKVAAQNCRKRKMDQINGLQGEVNRLSMEKARLNNSKMVLMQLQKMGVDKYRQLYAMIQEGAAIRNRAGIVPFQSEGPNGNPNPTGGVTGGVNLPIDFPETFEPPPPSQPSMMNSSITVGGQDSTSSRQ